MRAAFASVKDPGVAMGLWLTTIAGLGFGVLDVLAPFRLNQLGASALLIGATFLATAAVESGLPRSPAGWPIGAGRICRSGSRWRLAWC